MNKIVGIPLVLVALAGGTAFLVLVVMVPMFLALQDDVRGVKEKVENVERNQLKEMVAPSPEVMGPIKPVSPTPTKAVKTPAAPAATTSGR